MGAKRKNRRYEGVEILFANLHEASIEIAAVLFRDDEMVIDIQDPNDHVTNYLIVGKPVGYFFRGGNSAAGNAPRVAATWTKLGQSFVGEWIEEGIEYLFSFELKN